MHSIALRTIPDQGFLPVMYLGLFGLFGLGRAMRAIRPVRLFRRLRLACRASLTRSSTETRP